MSHHLARLPRSPHQHTPEFARGWRARHNRLPLSHCPYRDALAAARWVDGYKTATAALTTRRAAAPRPKARPKTRIARAP